jgi:Adenylate and Guanylate cyclase catalytic domain
MVETKQSTGECDVTPVKSFWYGTHIKSHTNRFPQSHALLPASLTCKVCDPSVAAYYTVHSYRPQTCRFPETTVLFAGIAGFTAWSSVREPEQVFTLLETLEKAFDELATKRKVFKVL